MFFLFSHTYSNKLVYQLWIRILQLIIEAILFRRMMEIVERAISLFHIKFGEFCITDIYLRNFSRFVPPECSRRDGDPRRARVWFWLYFGGVRRIERNAKRARCGVPSDIQMLAVADDEKGYVRTRRRLFIAQRDHLSTYLICSPHLSPFLARYRGEPHHESAHSLSLSFRLFAHSASIEIIC